jgi:Integrase core domain
MARSSSAVARKTTARERMHADMRRELQSIAAPNVEQHQRACDAWRTEFNHVRPHEALEMKTPIEVYRASRKRPVIRVGGWPADCQQRIVDDDRGFVRFDMLHVYVATALAGYTVGLRREWAHTTRLGDMAPGDSPG